VLPNLSAVAGHRDGYGVNWHVPIDDAHHWRFGIQFRRSAAIRRGGQQTGDRLPGYRLARSKENRYLQDREEMKTRSFTGMGRNFIVHDTMATEGAGPIQDRTAEHPGYTDRGIFASRKVLEAAIRDVQEGKDPPHVVRDPSKNRWEHIVARNDVLVPSEVDWHNFWENDVELINVGEAFRSAE